MDCVTIEETFQMRDGILSKKRQREVEKHIQTCEQCKQQLLSVSAFNSLIPMKVGNGVHPQNECLLESSIGAFIDGQLEGKEKEKVELHLSHCDNCLNQVVKARKILNEMESGRLDEVPEWAINQTKDLIPDNVSQIGLINNLISFTKFKIGEFRTISAKSRWVGIAASIIILSLLIVSPKIIERLIDKDKTPEIYRGKKEELVQLIQPINGSKVNHHNIVFQWEEIAQTIEYRFLLLNEIGDILYQQKTTKNQITLAQNFKLEAGQGYFWSVEVQFPNGEVIISKPSHFQFALE